MTNTTDNPEPNAIQKLDQYVYESMWDTLDRSIDECIIDGDKDEAGAWMRLKQYFEVARECDVRIDTVDSGQLREMLAQAFMSGQCDCGVDPSHHESQVYANQIVENME